jgi:hypothetical protein
MKRSSSSEGRRRARRYRGLPTTLGNAAHHQVCADRMVSRDCGHWVESATALVCAADASMGS